MNDERIENLSERVKMLETLFEKIGDDKLAFSVGRLRLEPGDIVVLKTDLMLDRDQHRAIRDRAQDIIRNNEVMILTHGFDIGVMGAQKVEAGEE